MGTILTNNYRDEFDLKKKIQRLGFSRSSCKEPFNVNISVKTSVAYIYTVRSHVGSVAIELLQMEQPPGLLFSCAKSTVICQCDVYFSFPK